MPRCSPCWKKPSAVSRRPTIGCTTCTPTKYSGTCMLGSTSARPAKTSLPMCSSVWCKLCRASGSMRTRPVASFSAWLYRIAGNLLTDEYRKQNIASTRHRDAVGSAERSRARLTSTRCRRGRAAYRLKAALTELGGRAAVGLAIPFCRGVQPPRGRRSDGKNRGRREGIPASRRGKFTPLLAPEASE